jgi:hypothetical protein
MHYRAIPQTVQAVEWDGQQFSEQPDWLPSQVGLASFAINPLQKLCCTPPFAFYGGEDGPIRLKAGDEIVYENGKIRVLSGETFRELFEPTLRLVTSLAN